MIPCSLRTEIVESEQLVLLREVVGRRREDLILGCIYTKKLDRFTTDNFIFLRMKLSNFLIGKRIPLRPEKLLLQKPEHSLLFEPVKNKIRFKKLKNCVAIHKSS